MKVLYINMFFKLPDNFEGTLNDAIMEMVKYRESKGHEPPKLYSRESEGKDTTPSMIELWTEFQQSTEKGFKLHGAVSCSEYDSDNKKWNSIIN